MNRREQRAAFYRLTPEQRVAFLREQRAKKRGPRHPKLHHVIAILARNKVLLER